MTDFFNRVYTSITDRNVFLKKIRYYSLLRFSTRVSANFLLRIYFKVAKRVSLPSVKDKGNATGGIIVSLTSFPARINNLWLVIESLLRQTTPPKRIILRLARSQFSDMASIPKNLLRLKKRGLEIKFCDEDLRSHKKYYYALCEFANDLIVTVDDDIIYHTGLIEQLLKLYELHPGAICCQRAMSIKFEGHNIAPYEQWQLLKSGAGPSFVIFQTSGGGTLFPPGALHSEVLNKQVFMKYCLHADDVWLNAMSQFNNVKIVKTDSYIECLPVINFGNKSLHNLNITLGGNDKQIADVRKYYVETIGKDIFANIFNE